MLSGSTSQAKASYFKLKICLRIGCSNKEFLLREDTDTKMNPLGTVEISLHGDHPIT